MGQLQIAITLFLIEMFQQITWKIKYLIWYFFILYSVVFFSVACKFHLKLPSLVEACQPGQRKAAGEGCEDCPKGYYQELFSQPHCEKCQAGKTTAQNASTVERQCIGQQQHLVHSSRRDIFQFGRSENSNQIIFINSFAKN